MSASGRNGRSPGDVHIFVYGTLCHGEEAVGLLGGCERVRRAEVRGMLFDIGSFPVLVLAGQSRVRGEVWRCPPELIRRLDEYEGITDGVFRRVGVEVDGTACWTYVAGPAIATRLEPDRRVESGRWRPPGAGGD